MYVWVIGKAIPTKKNNMYGSFEFEQAAMLARHGLKIIYIGLDFRPINHLRKWGISKNIFDGFVAYECSIPIRPLPIIQKKAEMFFCKRLYKKIEKENGLPDLIHVHFPAIMNHLIHAEYQKKGIRIVATEHWTQVLTKKLSNVYLDNLKWFVNNADAMLCVGEPLRKSIYELVNTKKTITIIPNIINNEFCYSPNNNGEKFIFIGVGRLVPVKRFDLMINAFANAFLLNDQVELNIVGGGEEFTKLQKQIDQLGRNKQIHLLGVRSRKETAKEIQKADALICASNLETFGVPVIEGWACGKPVICTDALGFLEYFDDSLGIIVKANNEKQMINAMNEIFEKRHSYDSKKISDFALKNFSEDAVFDMVEKIYRRLIL